MLRRRSTKSGLKGLSALLWQSWKASTPSQAAANRTTLDLLPSKALIPQSRTHAPLSLGIWHHPATAQFLSSFQGRCFATATRQGISKENAAMSQRQRLQKTSAQQSMYLIALVVGMVGLTYASVPLYRMFCQATGYGGTVQQGSTVEEKLQKRLHDNDISLEAAAAARNLLVSFNADVSDGMNWKFVPTQRSVRINPGQSTLAFYTAHNLSDKAITGVSTYNVSPQQAGAYFNKIQCFCFEEQKLRPGEKIDMPVFFYIDPEFATDPRMRGIDSLTLSYTFFKVDEEDVEDDSTSSEDARSSGHAVLQPSPA